MKRVLLTVMFVLSLFIMCGGCDEEEHHWGRHSERWEREGDRDRDRDRDWDREQHEEHHGEVRW